MTPLTAAQYSELVVALEGVRYGFNFVPSICTPFAYVYLTQWFHIVGVNPLTCDRDLLLLTCERMVAELCAERCV